MQHGRLKDIAAVLEDLRFLTSTSACVTCNEISVSIVSLGNFWNDEIISVERSGKHL